MQRIREPARPTKVNFTLLSTGLTENEPRSRSLARTSGVLTHICQQEETMLATRVNSAA